MTRIKPFNALYFDQSKAGSISRLVSPPYDVISPEESKALRALSPYNTIHIELGEPGDGAFYERAAGLIEAWLKDGVLKRGARPSIYFCGTEFSFHMGGKARRAARRGFFALLGVSDYEQGEVLRHEHTLKGPKQDRLQLLRAARANISPIFVLYADPGLSLISALENAKPSEPAFNFAEANGSEHKLFGISDQTMIRMAVDALQQKKVYIADGHHRYETALNFCRELSEKKDPLAQAAGWVMAYFCPIEDPGLVIFPYHRLVRELPPDRSSGILDRVKPNFSVKLIAEHFDRKSAASVFKTLDSARKDRIVIMIDGSRQTWLLKLKKQLGGKFKEKLDVEIFKELILEQALRVTQQEVAEKNYLAFETKEELVIKRLEAEDFRFAFLLRPISVMKVVERAERGEVMPQKSTYFYPKLPSGLVFRKLASGPELSERCPKS